MIHAFQCWECASEWTQVARGVYALVFKGPDFCRPNDHDIHAIPFIDAQLKAVMSAPA